MNPITSTEFKSALHSGVLKVSIQFKLLSTSKLCQLDQGQERQDVELDVSEADRLPDSEPTADSITVAAIRTRVDMQGQSTCTDEVRQGLVDLSGATTSLANTVNSLQKEYEELNQEQVDMQRRLAKAEEDMNATLQPFRLILESPYGVAPEQIKIAGANLSGLEDLRKKRKIEETERQKQRAKWLKLKADVKELKNKRVLG